MSFLESELLIKVNRSSNEVLIPKKMYVDSAGHDLFANESIKVCARSTALVTAHPATRRHSNVITTSLCTSQ